MWWVPVLTFTFFLSFIGVTLYYDEAKMKLEMAKDKRSGIKRRLNETVQELNQAKEELERVKARSNVPCLWAPVCHYYCEEDRHSQVETCLPYRKTIDRIRTEHLS